MSQKEMYLVQKCWFDGPNVQPPQDYLALFPSRAQAEEVASRTAYIHAGQCQAVVRTILLPSGYAFSAGGDLFWIRSVVVDVSNSNNAVASYKGAHAISNRGVVGGTGNVNSRRGSEIQTGVVFVGSDSYSRARQVLTHGGVPTNSQITFLPFAPLPNLLDGWIGTNMKEAAASVAALEDSLKKRSARQAANVVLHSEALAECSDYRPMKRHCCRAENHHKFSRHSVEQVDALMNSS
ncbi:hypothetical protein ACA910_019461 [Epithemia clementina (nom. ined.)]